MTRTYACEDGDAITKRLAELADERGLLVPGCGCSMSPAGEGLVRTIPPEGCPVHGGKPVPAETTYLTPNEVRKLEQMGPMPDCAWPSPLSFAGTTERRAVVLAMIRRSLARQGYRVGND